MLRSKKALNNKKPVIVEENQNKDQLLNRGQFPVVGIGASAGGLAACEAFFSNMPAEIDPGMAFVLVQHLAPDYKSILSDLIRRYTQMQVFEVEDGMQVKPNCIYVIPPNFDMALLNGELHLLDPASPRGHRLPIDFFFRSLAQDQEEHAICVVLSGTGSDGSQGVRAIKGAGGMAMAQKPESAEYDGMPRSAIATGLVDYVLPPAEMPAHLISYTNYINNRPPKPIPDPMPKEEADLKKIFILLRVQTGHDFSLYKPSTILRRIERRMAVNQIKLIDDYIKFLRHSPKEVDDLFRNLLIGVTNFFRDPEAFAAFEKIIIPKIFENKNQGETIRVWSPGCSTGEEAYSIAILLKEHMDTLRRDHKVQIFATDIDSQAIATARLGYYPASIAADVTPERLGRFFTSEDGGSAYRIHKNIRDTLVFSEHNVIKDPPFSKLDLISCRNLLIYFNGKLQKKILPLFHYILKPGGFLFFGTSESIGEHTNLFGVVDSKSKLYQRKEEIIGYRRVEMASFLPPLMESNTINPTEINAQNTIYVASLEDSSLSELTEQVLLKYSVPAAALINHQGDILYLHGRTGKFLEPASGEAGVNNILKMARDGLQRELATDLHKAVLTNEVVFSPNLRVKTNGDYTSVHLTVRPVTINNSPSQNQHAPDSLFLVILQQALSFDMPSAPLPDEEQDKSAAIKPGSEADVLVSSLREELRAKEEYLQAFKEELETANEELMSSNEEMQSVNEELQSSNEELETSREELQSINEELSTINAELEANLTDLSIINNDMNNLLAGTGIATLFVDLNLHILRFTPTATEIINLIQTDIGRPVSHIVSNMVNYEHLVEDIQAVLNTLIPKEVEVQTNKGAWFKMGSV